MFPVPPPCFQFPLTPVPVFSLVHLPPPSFSFSLSIPFNTFFSSSVRSASAPAVSNSCSIVSAPWTTPILARLNASLTVPWLSRSLFNILAFASSVSPALAGLIAATSNMVSSITSLSASQLWPEYLKNLLVASPVTQLSTIRLLSSLAAVRSAGCCASNGN